MKHKSMKLNMVLNAIRGILGVLFPLITFPYVSKILSVDNLGKYNFANSIISYFLLIAGLGVSTYAIREGAQIREDSKRFKKFSDEMFTINLTSTVISCLLLIVTMILVPKFASYQTLLLILSLQIIFKTIGIEWLYSIYEDYAYITIRSIIFQIVSLILLFVFVRTKDDVNVYATITVISSGGSNILNYIHGQKYCKVGVSRNVDWRTHLKPIMILFAMSVTVTVYVSSDMTILGFLSSDYDVGIYSVSVKVYNIIKTLLSSVLVVSVPRLSAVLGKQDKKSFSFIAEDIYKTLITVMLPTVVGIILLRKEIVILLSDATYIDSIPSLVLLSIALVFCMGAWFWGQCILVPLKKEKIVFKATVASAAVNVLANFILIPRWKVNAAAFTTVLAEGVAFIWCSHEGRKYVDISGIIQTVVKVLAGCIGIVVIVVGMRFFELGQTIYVVTAVALSIIVYFIIEIAVKNRAIASLITEIKRKL